MIVVSVISHDHGQMLPPLLENLLSFPEVRKIIVTLNTFENPGIEDSNRVYVIHNEIPKGFGANHNKAFELCNEDYFCVVNPDIIFLDNPFPKLTAAFIKDEVGLVVPMVINHAGFREDSIRHFISPWSLFRRYIFGYDDSYIFKRNDELFFAEWAAGMFMLFRSSTYHDLHGFDERYFLYVEDTDICTRLWLNGYKLIVEPGALVIHEARRATLKNLRHLYWHILGLFRYFFRYIGRRPKIER